MVAGDASDDVIVNPRSSDCGFLSSIRERTNLCSVIIWELT